MTENTATTARAYAHEISTLEQHRATALEHVNLGKLHASAHGIRRELDTDSQAIAASLAALDSLIRTTGLPDYKHEIAAGIAAQCALNAIRDCTRREVKALAITGLAALLDDPALTDMERTIGVDILHDRYAEKIGDDAYGEQLAAWIANGTPDSEARAEMFAELTAA